MEIRGMKISGLDAMRVRDALRAFLEVETRRSFENGQLKTERKILKADFLANELDLSEDAAATLLADLIAEGYIDPHKLTPTHRGMALSQAENRERLPLSEADRILGEFLDAVRKVNARPDARILVKRVYVFGSYLKRAATVGDIDLLVEMPLSEDCEPEDMDEIDVVTEEIKISDYLSFHAEWDEVAATAEKKLIYDHDAPA